MREFLKGLDLDSELIDTIMAEHGKLVTKDKEELQTLRSQIKELKENSISAEELQAKYNELLKQNEEREAQEKAKAEDEIITNNIVQAFGDKKFTSDYARNGLINDVKNALSKPENKGKGINDLIDELSKDKTGIFEVPNKVVDIPGANENVETSITKDKFDKMSYNERLQLKQDNPDLFKKLNE